MINFRIIPYVVLVSVLVGVIIMYAGILDLFFDMSKTIIAGVLGLTGAIIGGVITFVGVKYSIDHNEKVRMKNDLPDKLFRIESAKSMLEKIIDEDLVFERKESFNNPTNTYNFFRIDEELQLVELELLNIFTEAIPEKLKKDFVYIDSEAYRMFLDFKDKIYLLKIKIFNDVEIKLMDFIDKAKESLDDYGEYDVYLITMVKENIELKKEMLSLFKMISKKDREYSFHLTEIYNDLYMQILVKHEQLIEELDY